MGSSSSKAARGATGAARKFPTRAPGTAVPPQAASRTKPSRAPRTDAPKDDAVRTDAIDPDMTPGDFSRRLQQMGVAQPNPTYSPSSTASNHLSPEASIAPAGPLFPSAKHNATLSVLECRRELQQRADDELKAIGRGSPRRFINIRTLVDAFQLLKRGVPAIDIEKRFNLEPGLLSKLGRPSILSHQSSGN